MKGLHTKLMLWWNAEEVDAMMRLHATAEEERGATTIAPDATPPPLPAICQNRGRGGLGGVG